MNEEPKTKWSWPLLRWGVISLAVLLTLAAATVTEENWRGKRAWENYQRLAEARGERLDWLSRATNQVPDDQNFTKAPVFSGIYSRVWDEKDQSWKSVNTNAEDRLDISIYFPDGSDPDDHADWTQARLTHIEGWQKYYRNPKPQFAGVFPLAPQPQSPAADVLLALSKYDSTVEELRTASHRPFSQFGITNVSDSKGFSLMLEYLASFKRCTQLLRLRAAAELADHQSAKALDDVQLLLRLDDELRQEPLLISQLVSVAINALTFQPIYEGLAQHRWNDAQLAELETSLAKKDFLADFQMAMRGERTFAVETLENQRITRQYQIAEDGGSGKTKIVTVNLRWTPSAFFYQNELSHARLTEQYCLPLVDLDKRIASPAALRRAVTAVQRTVVQSGLKHFSPYKITAFVNFPAISRSVEKFAQAQSHTDLALVACALERCRLANGGYPETLDALAPQYIKKLPHDIINGQPLHYRRTDDGLFVLYSVGWNEADDGGQIILNKNGVVDQKQGDWVWRYPANEK